jgi:hypothetical protein
VKTCASCWFYEPIHGSRVEQGNCLAEPPTCFLVPAPPTSVQRPAQPPATMGIERITLAARKACRHYSEHREKLDG